MPRVQNRHSQTGYASVYKLVPALRVPARPFPRAQAGGVDTGTDPVHEPGGAPRREEPPPDEEEPDPSSDAGACVSVCVSVCARVRVFASRSER
jgi:hypothetical protein